MKVIATFLLILYIDTLFAIDFQSITASKTRIRDNENVDIVLNYNPGNEYFTVVAWVITPKGEKESYELEVKNLKELTFTPKPGISGIYKIYAKISSHSSTQQKYIQIVVDAAAKTCKEWYERGERENKKYPLDPDGDGPLGTVMLYCDMEHGGWTRFDWMVSGWTGWPGHGRTKIIRRIQENYVQLYKALAQNSQYEKFDVAYNKHEGSYDPAYFMSYDYHTIVGGKDCSACCRSCTRRYDGYVFSINRDWRRALWYTKYQTDCCDYGGEGSYMNNIVWFK